MQNLYYFLFKILLILPLFGILNSIYMNKFFKIQKIVNNTIYISLILICSYIFIMFTGYGKYDLTLFSISKDIPIIFSINPINITFAFFVSIAIFFLNFVFQDSFNYLNLSSKYILYNKQVSYLYYFYILLSFSSSIVVSFFLYLLIIIYSFFLIINPDLKEFRKKYNIVFCASLISNMILILLIAFYFFYNQSALFAFQEINGFDTISGYWILIILFLLILVNFFGPIYFIFNEKLYYEDLLPLFIIFFFPFTFFNTFLFFKILYYIFYNSFALAKIYFYYSQLILFLSFLTSCFFASRFIKNSIKFILLFLIMNFIIFVSQILFISNDIQLAKLFSNFLFFVLASLIVVLSYSGLLFLLLKTKVTDLSIFYKKSKIELNFYIFCLFMPILVNLLLFFDLNFKNFNFLYLINLIEILISFAFYILYIYLSLNEKKKDNKTEVAIDISSEDRINFFKSQVVLVFIFFFLLLLKSQIVKYITFYK